jgi:hypothetical protein
VGKPRFGDRELSALHAGADARLDLFAIRRLPWPIADAVLVRLFGVVLERRGRGEASLWQGVRVQLAVLGALSARTAVVTDEMVDVRRRIRVRIEVRA